MTDTLHVVCPHCEAKNRLPAARLSHRPTCGRCKARLFEGHPVELRASTFDRHVEGTDLPVLVDFWAPWCGHCQSMAPVVAQAAAQLEPRVRVAKVDTEGEKALAARFGIHSLPTLVLFKGGREVARQAGALPLPSLLGWVRSHT